MQPHDAILYEHKDGRYAVNPDTSGDPGWHRLGPVDVSALLSEDPPRGWLVQWPSPAGGSSWVYHDGPTKMVVPFHQIPVFDKPPPKSAATNSLRMHQPLPFTAVGSETEHHAQAKLLYKNDEGETPQPWERWEWCFADEAEPLWQKISGHPTWDPCFAYRRIVPVSFIYMRDNHTFRRLSGTADDMLVQCREEFDSGWNGGSLFMRPGDSRDSVTAHGPASWEAFEKAARALLQRHHGFVSDGTHAGVR